MGDQYPGGQYPGGHDGYADGYGLKRGREDDFVPNKRQAPEQAYGGSETVFRFLCDLKIVGGMIGKGGSNIREVQQHTGAFIQVIHESPPHCTERVFVIASPKPPVDGDFNSAQLALFSIFDKQLNLERNGSAPGGPFLRMLICATQAGSFIGKGGAAIKELKEQSGCSNIKVLQPDDLPPCALASDKLLHITGPPDSLRKVLQLASSRLRDSPPKELPSHQPCKNAYPPPGPGPGRPGGPSGNYMGGPPPDQH